MSEKKDNNYRSIVIEKNKIKWYTKLLLLGAVAILIWGGEIKAILFFVCLSILLTIIKWSEIIRFFLGKDYFLYDNHGILKYKIRGDSVEDILFADIIDLQIDNTAIIFSKEHKRLARKDKKETFHISLQGLSPLDIEKIQSIFLDNLSLRSLKESEAMRLQREYKNRIETKSDISEMNKTDRQNNSSGSPIIRY